MNFDFPDTNPQCEGTVNRLSTRVPESGYLEFTIGMEIYDRIIRVTADDGDFKLPQSRQFEFIVDNGALIGGKYDAPCTSPSTTLTIQATDTVPPRLLEARQETSDVSCENLPTLVMDQTPWLEFFFSEYVAFSSAPGAITASPVANCSFSTSNTVDLGESGYVTTTGPNLRFQMGALLENDFVSDTEKVCYTLNFNFHDGVLSDSYGNNFVDAYTNNGVYCWAKGGAMFTQMTYDPYLIDGQVLVLDFEHSGSVRKGFGSFDLFVCDDSTCASNARSLIDTLDVHNDDNVAVKMVSATKARAWIKPTQTSWKSGRYFTLVPSETRSIFITPSGDRHWNPNQNAVFQATLTSSSTTNTVLFVQYNGDGGYVADSDYNSVPLSEDLTIDVYSTLNEDLADPTLVYESSGNPVTHTVTKSGGHTRITVAGEFVTTDEVLVTIGSVTSKYEGVAAAETIYAYDQTAPSLLTIQVAGAADDLSVATLQIDANPTQVIVLTFDKPVFITDYGNWTDISIGSYTVTRSMISLSKDRTQVFLRPKTGWPTLEFLDVVLPPWNFREDSGNHYLLAGTQYTLDNVNKKFRFSCVNTEYEPPHFDVCSSQGYTPSPYPLQDVAINLAENFAQARLTNFDTIGLKARVLYDSARQFLDTIPEYNVAKFTNSWEDIHTRLVREVYGAGVLTESLILLERRQADKTGIYPLYMAPTDLSTPRYLSEFQANSNYECNEFLETGSLLQQVVLSFQFTEPISPGSGKIQIINPENGGTRIAQCDMNSNYMIISDEQPNALRVVPPVDCYTHLPTLQPLVVRFLDDVVRDKRGNSLNANQVPFQTFVLSTKPVVPDLADTNPQNGDTNVIASGRPVITLFFDVPVVQARGATIEISKDGGIYNIPADNSNPAEGSVTVSQAGTMAQIQPAGPLSQTGSVSVTINTGAFVSVYGTLPMPTKTFSFSVSDPSPSTTNYLGNPKVYNATMLYVQDKLLVLGGSRDGITATSEVSAIDPSTGQWEQVSINGFTAKSGGQVFAVTDSGQTLYTIGGTDIDGNPIYEFKKSSDGGKTWSNMPIPDYAPRQDPKVLWPISVDENDVIDQEKCEDDDVMARKYLGTSCGRAKESSMCDDDFPYYYIARTICVTTCGTGCEAVESPNTPGLPDVYVPSRQIYRKIAPLPPANLPDQSTPSKPWTALAGHVVLTRFDWQLIILGGGQTSIWMALNAELSLWTEATEDAQFGARYNPTAGVMSDGSLVLVGGWSTQGQALTDVWTSKEGVIWTQASGSLFTGISVSTHVPFLPGYRLQVLSDDTLLLSGVQDVEVPQNQIITNGYSMLMYPLSDTTPPSVMYSNKDDGLTGTDELEVFFTEPLTVNDLYVLENSVRVTEPNSEESIQMDIDFDLRDSSALRIVPKSQWKNVEYTLRIAKGTFVDNAGNILDNTAISFTPIGEPVPYEVDVILPTDSSTVVPRQATIYLKVWRSMGGVKSGRIVKGHDFRYIAIQASNGAMVRYSAAYLDIRHVINEVGNFFLKVASEFTYSIV